MRLDNLNKASQIELSAARGGGGESSRVKFLAKTFFMWSKDVRICLVSCIFSLCIFMKKVCSEIIMRIFVIIKVCMRIRIYAYT